jgi:hypothetical protein
MVTSALSLRWVKLVGYIYKGGEDVGGLNKMEEGEREARSLAATAGMLGY